MFKQIMYFYYTSFIFKLYKYTVNLPFIKFFIDYDYFKCILISNAFIRILFKNYRKMISSFRIIKIPKPDIFTLTMFLYLIILIPIKYQFILYAITFYYSVAYISDKSYILSGFFYFSVCIFAFCFSLIFNLLFGININYIFSRLWCIATIFILTSSYLKQTEFLFTKYNFSFLLLLSLSVILLSPQNYELQNILMLTPFSYQEIFINYKGIKKNVILYILSVILIYTSVFFSIPLFIGLATEIIVIFSLSDIKRLPLLFLIMPAFIVKLIKKFLKNIANIDKKTFKDILKSFIIYFNNGLKGGIKPLENTLKSYIDITSFENLNFSEKLIPTIIIIFMLALIFFLGKYIFKIIRKLIIIFVSTNESKESSAASLAYFIGTSIYFIISYKLDTEINISLLYWYLLGKIKSKSFKLR